MMKTPLINIIKVIYDFPDFRCGKVMIPADGKLTRRVHCDAY